jgi:hypothetical protein
MALQVAKRNLFLLIREKKTNRFVDVHFYQIKKIILFSNYIMTLFFSMFLLHKSENTWVGEIIVI